MADVNVIQIGIEAAGVIATGIAGGLTAGAKVLVWFLKDRDKGITTELKKTREATDNYTQTLLGIQRDSITAVSANTAAVDRNTSSLSTVCKHGPPGSGTHYPLPAKA